MKYTVYIQENSLYSKTFRASNKKEANAKAAQIMEEGRFTEVNIPKLKASPKFKKLPKKEQILLGFFEADTTLIGLIKQNQ